MSPGAEQKLIPRLTNGRVTPVVRNWSDVVTIIHTKAYPVIFVRWFLKVRKIDKFITWMTYPFSIAAKP